MIIKLDLTEQVGRVLWLEGWMDAVVEGTNEPEPYPQGVL